MEDVIGYEEKAPETLSALRSGYPRFFQHADISELAKALQENGEIPAGVPFLVANRALLAALIAFVGSEPSAHGAWREFVWCVYPKEAEDAVTRAKRFLQHTGASISSRQAEDGLIALGRRGFPFPEAQRPAENEAVERALAPWFGASPAEITLTQGGMNAFYALFQAANATMGGTGRRRWVQLGWLYVDTIKILETMSPPDAAPLVWHDALDLAGLAAALEPIGDEIVGIVAELPTNPLIQTADVSALRALADKLGCLLVLDPSIASIGLVDVLPWADAVVTSLTKYTAREGDVMIGAVAVNPARPYAAALGEAIPAGVVPPYGRDLTRFAAELEGWTSFVAEAASNAAQVARFLESHPAVDRVWWSGSAKNAPGFARIARSGDPSLAVCPVISFSVRGDMARFYDAVEVVKGPSFGTAYTLLSPFMYLAHYDLVTSEEGRALLARAGVPGELMRLSVGAEPVEAIIAALEQAFACMK
jgi:cystathionine gamma-synthase